MKHGRKITVLVLEPAKDPYVSEIEDSLTSLQSMVGGYIQVIYPFDDPVALIANEEGKLLGLPWNRPLVDNEGFIYDVVVGTFLVTGLTEDNFGSLSQELIEKYTQYFRQRF